MCSWHTCVRRNSPWSSSSMLLFLSCTALSFLRSRFFSFLRMILSDREDMVVMVTVEEVDNDKSAPNLPTLFWKIEGMKGYQIRTAKPARTLY